MNDPEKKIIELGLKLPDPIKLPLILNSLLVL